MHTNPPSHRKALVVDDNALTCRFLSRHLQSLGFEVASTTDARQTLVLARDQRPDLVVLDVMLNDGLDGFDVCRELKQSEPTRGLPVIMVSGECKTAEGDRKAEAAGAVAFIEKTYVGDELPGAIRKAEGISRRCEDPRAEGRILVVDDDAQMRDLVRFTLERRYRTVWFGQTGKAGFQRALDLRPSLVLLDMVLPDLNGVEVYSLLKGHEQTKGIPVLVMTGMADEADVFKTAIIKLGVSDFVRKPFGENELIMHVERLLKHGPTQPPAVLERGCVKLDTVHRRVWVRGKLKCENLGPKRLGVLRMLLEREGLVSRKDLYDVVWNGDEDPRIVDKTVSRLREDLGIKEGEVIVSHPGGYQLVG